MQGIVKNRQGIKPLRDVESPEWTKALTEQLLEGPKKSALAKEHPIASTLGYAGKFFVADPLKYLGDTLGEFQEKGEISAKDAAQFGLFGLGMGWPGGAEVGEASTLGSITHGRLPFKTQLEDVMAQRRVGKILLGEQPRGRVVRDAILQHGDSVLRDELRRTGLEDTLTTLGENRIGGDKAYRAMQNVAKEYGESFTKTEYSYPDTEYHDWNDYRSPLSPEGYREVLYHQEGGPEFEVGHFERLEKQGQIADFSKIGVNQEEALIKSVEKESYYDGIYRRLRKRLDESTDFIEQRALNRRLNELRIKLETERYYQGALRSGSIEAYKKVPELESARKELLKAEKNYWSAELEKDYTRSKRLKAKRDEWEQKVNRLYHEINHLNYLAQGGKRANQGLLMHRRMNEMRVGDKEVSILDEVQSDLHREGGKWGYRDEREKWSRRISELEKERNELDMKIWHEFENAKKNKQPVKRELVRKLEKKFRDTNKALAAAERKVEGAVPATPLRKDWWKVLVNDSLKEAAERGKDELWITSGDLQINRNMRTEEKASFYKNMYDKNIPKYIKKRYGVTPVRVLHQFENGKTGVYWRIPLEGIKHELLKHSPMAWKKPLKNFMPA